MKKKIFIMVGCILLLSSTAIIAQWKVVGNNLTAPGKLGSLNDQPIIFISDNGNEQGTLSNKGLWGFGTQTPSAKVHINSTASQIPLSVDVNGSSKFFVSSNGGAVIGHAFLSLPPANGLWVVGNAGIG